MKRVIAILLTLCLTAALFAACSAKKTENNDPKNSEPATYIGAPSTITTDEAKITDADALHLMQSYSPEELSLTEEEMAECSFMVKKSGVEIDGDYYIEVIATIKTENKKDDGSVTYTFDNKGAYYIRFDGKQILKKDMSAAEPTYEELEVKEVPQTTAAEETSE